MAPQERPKDLIYQLDLDIDLAIVIGAEGKGMRPLVKKKCDRLFSIPMKGPLSSFNASVSGGMILYEVMRQRSLHHPPPTLWQRGDTYSSSWKREVGGI